MDLHLQNHYVESQVTPSSHSLFVKKWKFASYSPISCVQGQALEFFLLCGPCLQPLHLLCKLLHSLLCLPAPFPLLIPLLQYHLHTHRKITAFHFKIPFTFLTILRTLNCPHQSAYPVGLLLCVIGVFVWSGLACSEAFLGCFCHPHSLDCCPLPRASGKL